MLRVALFVLIALSALPFAATAPRAALSDVRAAEARPTERFDATATSTPRIATPAAATATPSPGSARRGDVVAPPTARPPVIPQPPTATSTPQPPPTGIELVIATRGDHRLPHDITLDASLRRYSWGKHGTEDNKTLPDDAGSVNLWLGVSRDASELDAELDVRVNIRNMRGYVYESSKERWVEIYNGPPTWMVSVDNVAPFNYHTIAPAIEADGSYSFEIPPGRGLHMSSPVPGLEISESDGVLCLIDARLIGPGADAARLGLAAGADYRDASGSGDSIEQAGFGQLGLLVPTWKTFSMLSSALSDDEIRANPPPGAP